MKRFSRSLLLSCLYALVVGKRLFFAFGFFIYKGIRRCVLFFRNTVGIVVYTWWFRYSRNVLGEAFSFGSKLFALLGTRFSLQIILLVLVSVTVLPHSQFRTVDTVLAGRNTLLYAFVGPGDEFLEVEEVVADVRAPSEYLDTQYWRVGTVSGDMEASGINVVDNLSAISAGGTALTKPIILSDDAMASITGSQVGAADRHAIVYHEVQPGDVIGAIAEKYDISVSTILWANNLTARSYIRPGDRLKILPVDGVLHKVQKGDTVAKIAKNYSADSSQIIAFNTLQNDGSDIVIGEELLVPGGKKTVSIALSQPASQGSSQFRRITAPPASVEAPAGTGYIWPTSVRRITQYYGLRHTGVDIAGPIGTPLYAVRSGSVIKSQCGWNGGYGCYIIVDHGDGITSLYAHASQLLVSVGDEVTQGQTIALMGSTGRSTGPHIHFEIRVNGQRANPLSYVR